MENKCINSEQAFDMLPYVEAIYEKVDFEGYRKQLAKNQKGKKEDDNDSKEISFAIDGFRHVLRNSRKVKAEFFAIVSIADSITIDQAKKQSYVKTIKTIKSIFGDPELVDFFKQAMQ